MKALAAAQRVTHEKYGLGVISESNTDYTVIEFDEHGKKKFLTRLVRLESSDAPAPKRRRASRKKATTKKATSKKATKKAATKAAAGEKPATKSATAKKATKAASSKKAS